MPPPPDDPVRVSGAPGSTRLLPRWLAVVAGALLVARVGTGIYEDRHPAQVPDLVRWRPIAGAEAESRRSRKPILYDFTADWCAPCRAMQREVFADAASAQQIETMFVPVRVLDRRQDEGRNVAEVDSLQKRFHVDSFPTLVVAWPDSAEPTVMSGYMGKTLTLQRLGQAAALRRGFRGTVRFP